MEPGKQCYSISLFPSTMTNCCFLIRSAYYRRFFPGMPLPRDGTWGLNSFRACTESAVGPDPFRWNGDCLRMERIYGRSCEVGRARSAGGSAGDESGEALRNSCQRWN